MTPTSVKLQTAMGFCINMWKTRFLDFLYFSFPFFFFSTFCLSSSTALTVEPVQTCDTSEDVVWCKDVHFGDGDHTKRVQGQIPHNGCDYAFSSQRGKILNLLISATTQSIKIKYSCSFLGLPKSVGGPTWRNYYRGCWTAAIFTHLDQFLPNLVCR